MTNPISYGFEKIGSALSSLFDVWSETTGIEGFGDFADFFDSFHLSAEQVFTTFFSFLASSFGWLNNFLFDFIFVDLVGSCRFYGTQIFNYFFSTFANKSFDFVYIEAVVGFTFVLYCLRLIIHIVRG